MLSNKSVEKTGIEFLYFFLDFCDILHILENRFSADSMKIISSRFIEQISKIKN